MTTTKTLDTLIREKAVAAKTKEITELTNQLLRLTAPDDLESTIPLYAIQGTGSDSLLSFEQSFQGGIKVGNIRLRTLINALQRTLTQDDSHTNQKAGNVAVRHFIQSVENLQTQLDELGYHQNYEE